MTAGGRTRARTARDRADLPLQLSCMYSPIWTVASYADAMLASDTSTLGRHHGLPVAVLVAAAVAGDGIGNPRVLFAF